MTALGEKALREIRGNHIAMMFQEPMSAFSPLHTIGNQVCEVLSVHGKGDGKAEAMDVFARVGFVEPQRAFDAYPFELSGGMRQRAMIAMAMVAKPDLIIADEPTTALDVTTQAQVLGLMKDLQAESGTAIIIVTHDLGVVANVADTVAVMRKGRVMEAGGMRPVLSAPQHGYTQKLVAAAPLVSDGADKAVEPAGDDFILKAERIHKTYIARTGAPWAPKAQIKAVDGIDFAVPRGQTLAVVGQSGSGKSTVARIALGAEKPDPGGSAVFLKEQGGDPLAVHDMDEATRRAFQREAQMVFQDPYAALSPRLQVLDILTEPLEIHGIGTPSERRENAADLMEKVGLDPAGIRRYPHAFSGGQRQRISIARALALAPKLLVCDEPTSALDVSVQAQVMELLEDIKEAERLSYLFISHDLAVVAHIADSVAVMRAGHIVEQAPPSVLFSDPVHPYTRALIAASPEPDLNHLIDLKEVSLGAGAPNTWPEAFREVDGNRPDLREISPEHKVRSYA